MYKVLIADDEARERNIVRILLEREYPEMLIFYEASNGEAALKEFEEKLPHLVIMDIRMPGMNGIEVIKEIRKKSLDVYIIIVTAYNYFEFAKEAIRMGVNDFILKPPSRENFNQAISKFMMLMKKRESNRKDLEENNEKIGSWISIMRNDMAMALAYGGVEEDHIDDYFDILNIKYDWGVCILTSLDTNSNRFYKENGLDIRWHLEKINNYIDKYMNKNALQYISGIQGKRVIVFLFLKEKEKKESREKSIKVSQDILRYLNYECSFSIQIGIGLGYLLPRNLNKSYEEALAALKSKTKVCHNEPIYVYESQQQDIEDNSMNFESMLAKKIRERDKDEAIDILIETLTYLKKKYGNKQMIIKVRLIDFLSSISKSCLCKDNVSKYLEDLSPIISLEEYHEIIKFSQRFVEKLIEHVDNQQKKKRHFIIDRIITFVNENYHEALSVEEIAKKFSISSFYFSRLFKEYQNINFVDYITQVRIKKAIELFDDESLNIKEIAHLVGYHDANYFSRVFKKNMGLSPKKYRDRFLI
ncbi:response regulator [Wukongibacter sp. M2B1]|uniref:response regulator n=1 Tax=Wukongibacter sp. M2B1 TaxID=3088895 RepID=UPI003D7A0B9F